MKTKNLVKSSVSFNPCTQSIMESGEEIVISGIAGRFPDSDDMRHFQDNLFNKVDLITKDDRRWNMGETILWYHVRKKRKNIYILKADLTFRSS